MGAKRKAYVTVLDTLPQCTHGGLKDRCKTTTATDPLKWFNEAGTQRYCEEHGPRVSGAWRKGG